MSRAEVLVMVVGHDDSRLFLATEKELAVGSGGKRAGRRRRPHLKRPVFCPVPLPAPPLLPPPPQPPHLKIIAASVFT